MRASLLAGFLLAALPIAAQEAKFTDAPGHWPQWRGPNRDNVSIETGLLREWPEGGPKLLWISNQLADGFPPVTVAGGRIYGLGYRIGKEYLTSLDGSGRVVWSQEIGPQSGEFPAMRFVGQRSITVDDTILFAFTAAGKLLCLRTSDGQIQWQKDYISLGGSGVTSFGLADAPLVDGDLLICKPGGNKGCLAALNRKTGALVWQSSDFKDPPAYSPIIRAEIGGVSQYIVLSPAHVAGILAKTGKLAWIADRYGATAVVPTPIYHDGILFVTSGFGVGCNGFRISADGDHFKAEEIYSGKQMRNHRGGLVRIGDHVYGMDDNKGLSCIELKTGNVAWQGGFPKGSVIAADGLLVARGEQGQVALVEATPEGYRELSRFKETLEPGEPSWSQPVIAGGRLYLRHTSNLYCYDLRSPGYKVPPKVWNTPIPPVGAKPGPAAKVPTEKGPDAAFVPTPQDVVDRMLQLAKVTREDVVYDLGSGDGRIPIRAAKVYGCKAWGFEIVPELVQLSRAKAKEAGVEDQVKIVEKDLFKVDLGLATVVTLYLGAPNNERLLPELRRLKPGVRIVSHAHLLGEKGPKPDETIPLKSREDQEDHVLYLWTTPLKD